jgi:PAS domain S-box-containing protein
MPDPTARASFKALDLTRHRDESFRLLVETVIDYAIFLISPDGEILTWNRGAQRIKGYAADEVIGKNFSMFYASEERDAGLPWQLLEIAAREGRVESEGWRVRKDGTRFWADVVITALRDPNGDLYGFAKVTRDMTERRASEERERQLLAEQRAREAAEEALRVRDRFLSIAAHELKTPVTTLRLATDLLTQRHATGQLAPDALATGLARIGRATDRLTALVGELLDVSKLSAGRVTPNLAPIDVAQLVSAVIDLYRTAHEDREIRFSPSTPLVIEADAARLEQVVSNLIDNALKYSDPAEPVVVEVSAGDDGALIEVCDHGIGIDPGVLEALHEPFTRGANVGHIEGMGLGLYITNAIVASHGGTLRASSPGIGKGTTFTVWLPAAPSAAGGSASA